MDNFFMVLSMAGGLSLFLYGMSSLGTGLEKLSGGRMEKTLEKMTGNMFKSMLLGLLVTAAIQSSSATTVIVVGLVNAGILKLRNAVGVIMGANIGTTVTSIVLSLADLDQSSNASFLLKMLKPANFTPLFALIGIIMIMSCKRKGQKQIGEILLGFAILFYGMTIMTSSVDGLSELEAFHTLFATLSNPLLGVLAGTSITALIQSSSASVGILQAVASSGLVTYASAIPIIMGQNIGTCVTSLISSFGANKNAKRAAMVHLYFNVIGTFLFFVVYMVIYTMDLPFLHDGVSMSDVSTVHIIFNVATTLILMPFAGMVEKLAILTIPDKKVVTDEEDDSDIELAVLDERFMVSPSLALAQSRDVVTCMGKYAKRNLRNAVRVCENFDAKRAQKARENEDSIDRMEDRLNTYLVAVYDREITELESKTITHQLKMVLEFERIGDYAISVLDSAEKMYDIQKTFSTEAIAELKLLGDAVVEIVEMSIDAFNGNSVDVAKIIEPLEETVDKLEEIIKAMHIERLKNNECSVDVSLCYLDILSCLKRISDHCSNIGVYIIGFNSGEELSKHEYRQEIHEGIIPEYVQALEMYEEKYTNALKTMQKLQG